MSGPPVVDAWKTHDGCCWVVWCPFDNKFHIHGAGAGHRVAHCTAADSPYLKTGYILRYAGDHAPPKRELRREQEAAARVVRAQTWPEQRAWLLERGWTQWSTGARGDWRSPFAGDRGFYTLAAAVRAAVKLEAGVPG